VEAGAGASPERRAAGPAPNSVRTTPAPTRGAVVDDKQKAKKDKKTKKKDPAKANVKVEDKAKVKVEQK
jgi:hypothetical protein